MRNRETEKATMALFFNKMTTNRSSTSLALALAAVAS